MIFSSYKFILLFLPVTFLGYAVLNRYKMITLSKIWLIFASFYFYSQGSRGFLPFFLLTVLFNYALGTAIITYKRKQKEYPEVYRQWVLRILLFVGLAENIGLLGYYKYNNFFLENVNHILGTDFTLRVILLPLGISFFTFQLISYIVDCYKTEVKQYRFLDYMVFITFFPQLIMGPIVHHRDQIVQIENRENFGVRTPNVMRAIVFFSMGCAKKILLADPLIAHAQTFYNGQGGAGFFASWTAVLAYTFAYYFDFSGYGDMAIGLGLLFNIKLPVNFNSPYKARNFSDFWRRWNITLSNFLNTYIFKNIYKFGDKIGKNIFAVMVTFLVSGIWHGAGWHFIAWGMVNGIFVGICVAMTIYSKKLPFFLAWSLTFFGVLMTRVLFDSKNMTQALSVYKEMFCMGGQFEGLSGFLQSGYYFCIEHLGIILLLCAGAFICFALKNTQEIMEKFQPNWKYAALAGILLMLSLFEMSNVSQFLYFQF